MKLKLTALVLFSTVSLSTSFAKSTSMQDTHDTNQTHTTATQQADAPKNQMDGQVLAILMVLNQDEIAAADLMLKKKGVMPAVRKYAHMLHQEHNKSLKDTVKLSHSLGSPVQNATANHLKQHGENELATLNPLTGTALNKAYIDAMVSDHKAAIQLFDNDLLPHVSNQKLKSYLIQTRKHLVKHLQAGQAIQTKLNQASTTSTSS